MRQVRVKRPLQPGVNHATYNAAEDVYDGHNPDPDTAVKLIPKEWFCADDPDPNVKWIMEQHCEEAIALIAIALAAGHEVHCGGEVFYYKRQPDSDEYYGHTLRDVIEVNGNLGLFVHTAHMY